jgi:hypothetical protein
MRTKNLTLPLFEELPISKTIQELPEVKLPELGFDMTEQLCLALQNRDKNALAFVIEDKMDSIDLKSKQSFISNYLSYCKQLERKHGKLFILTIKGACNGKHCHFGKQGINVSVNSLVNNKQLWKFNLLIVPTKSGKLNLGKCYDMKLSKKDI